MIPALFVVSAPRLVRLTPVDMVIVGFYFALVLAIGFYLKQKANTSEDFFLAGREMTAWIAGLAFLSANLGALELMGWAAAAYQYGILATHWKRIPIPILKPWQPPSRPRPPTRRSRWSTRPAS